MQQLRPLRCTPSGAARGCLPPLQQPAVVPRRHRSATVAAAAGPAAAAAGSAAAVSTRLAIRQVTPPHYFPVSDLHTACFQTHSSPGDRLFQAFDRIWALQINADLARRGAGRCVLLVAFDPSRGGAAHELLQLPDALLEAAEAERGAAASTSSSPPSGHVQLPEQFAFPKLGYFLSRLVDRPVWPGLGQSYEQLGIVGVAQVDTFGDIIPPRTLSAKRDGAIGWVPRPGFAYVSNVAVCAAARRQGVARALMHQAEALAAAWGCSRAALHVNPTNAPAVELYRRLGYKKGVLEAPWMPYLQGRPPDRCLLMLKRLTLQQQQQPAGLLERGPLAAAGPAASH